MGLPVAVLCITVITAAFTCLTKATEKMVDHNTLLQCYSILEESAVKDPAEVKLPDPLIAAGYVIGSEQIRVGSYTARRSYVKQGGNGRILVDRIEFAGS